ncbi:Protein of unknown function [Propionibacterium freudenreichii]|nr:Protein of unknown function [Propionibacterium freudenreichii]
MRNDASRCFTYWCTLPGNTAAKKAAVARPTCLRWTPEASAAASASSTTPEASTVASLLPGIQSGTATAKPSRAKLRWPTPVNASAPARPSGGGAHRVPAGAR